jgi:hypothetical protein
MDHDEHFLTDILRIGFAHAEPPQNAPRIGPVLFEDGRKIKRVGLGLQRQEARRVEATTTSVEAGSPNYDRPFTNAAIFQNATPRPKFPIPTMLLC